MDGGTIIPSKVALKRNAVHFQMEVGVRLNNLDPYSINNMLIPCLPQNDKECYSFMIWTEEGALKRNGGAM